MAVVAGKGGTVKIGTAAIAQLESWSVDEETGTVDSSVMGLTSETHVPTLKRWQASIAVIYDPADATAQEALLAGTSTSVTINPAGGAVTTKNFSGTVTVLKCALSGTLTGMVKRTYELKGNGDLVRGTN